MTFKIVYRPSQIAAGNLPKRTLSLGAGNRSVIVTNRSPFWLALYGDGLEPVGVVEAWTDTTIDVDPERSTYFLAQYSIDEAQGPTVDFDVPDLPHLIGYQAFCEHLNPGVRQLVTAQVVITPANAPSIGSQISPVDLVPFTGLPESVDVAPNDNPWLTVTGTASQLVSAKDVAIVDNSSAFEATVATPNVSKSGIVSAVIRAEDLMNGAGPVFSTDITAEAATYPPGISIALGAQNVLANTISNPLGLTQATIAAAIQAEAVGTGNEASVQFSASSAKTFYAYSGQLLVLWAQITSATTGLIGAYDAANPANGFSASWTITGGNTASFSTPGFTWGMAQPSLAAVPKIATFDMSYVTDSLATGTGVQISAKVGQATPVIVQVNASAVNEDNPMPVVDSLSRMGVVLQNAPLAANGVADFYIDTADFLDSGYGVDASGRLGPSSVDYLAMMVYSDQAGTLTVFETDDEGNANLVATLVTQAVAAATLVQIKRTAINARYLHIHYLNGATAQTAFELTATFSKY